MSCLIYETKENSESRVLFCYNEFFLGLKVCIYKRKQNNYWSVGKTIMYWKISCVNWAHGKTTVSQINDGGNRSVNCLSWSPWHIPAQRAAEA